MTDEEKLQRYERMNDGYKPKFHKGKHIADYHTCGQCGAILHYGLIPNYCHNCGYRIKWDNPRCLTGVKEREAE